MLTAIATVSGVVLFSWLKIYQFMLMLLNEKNACMFQDLHTRNFRVACVCVLGGVAGN
jgi:hypothetical protein